MGALLIQGPGPGAVPVRSARSLSGRCDKGADSGSAGSWDSRATPSQGARPAPPGRSSRRAHREHPWRAREAHLRVGLRLWWGARRLPGVFTPHAAAEAGIAACSLCFCQVGIIKKSGRVSV